MILKHLVLIGRDQGLSKLEAVLAQNRAMLAVLTRSELWTWAGAYSRRGQIRGAFGCAAFRLQLVESIGNRHKPVDGTEPGIEPLAMQAVPHPRAGFDHLHVTSPFAELVSQICKRV